MLASVTEDKARMNGAGLSLDLNYHLAFVHHGDLHEALESDLLWRWKLRG